MDDTHPNTTGSAERSPPELVIEPKAGRMFPDFGEIWAYRDLFLFLVMRDIKVRYTQSVLGVGWAVVQPVFSMLVFTIVFGKLAKVNSDGVPYAIFSFAATVPWIYFSNALSESGGSLVASSAMLRKVYFPRVILPTAPVIAKLVDFSIAFLLLAGMMAWFHVVPTLRVAFLPMLVFLMALTSLGLGLWLSSLAVQYRDIKYGLSFGIQLLMYASPVVYPASLVPEPYRILYGLNPMAGVIEGFRSALLNTRPMPWDLLAAGTMVSLLILLTGLLQFRRMERVFSDVA